MMFLSFSVLVSLLALPVSALITPHGLKARDSSLAARHHHHIARQPSNRAVARRSARRKRCLERTTFPSSSPPSAFSSSSYSPPAVTTTSSNSVPDAPINVAPAPPTTTTPPTPSAPDQPATSAPYAPPPPPPADPTPSASPPSTGGGETHTGEGTFFDVGLGACGQTSANTDNMVAIGWELFDSFATGNAVGNPNLNPVCGRKIRATFGGKSVTVTALDRCGGCKRDDLDFSPSAFSQLADQSLGRLKDVQWQFI